MAMETSMDTFAVGQFVIQVEPVDLGMREAPGFGFSGLLGTDTLVKREDRSYMDRPYLIVAVELPFLVIERCSPHKSERFRSTVDARVHKFRVLSKEFVDAYLGTEGGAP